MFTIRRPPARTDHPPRKRLDIQGLRCVAVALVVAFHAGVPGFSGGYVGVDVFFVISGFLITQQLRRQAGRPVVRALLDFYAARIRRLLPMSLIVVVATLVMGRILLPPLRFPSTAADGLASALYFVNVRFADAGTAYLGNVDPSPFQHYWSLAVEEQYYVIWPIVILGLLATRASRRLVGPALALGGAASLAACLYLTTYKQPFAFFLFPSRAWEFAVGGLIALGAPAIRRRLKAPVGELLGWIGLAAILACGFLLTTRSVFPGYLATIPVLGTAAILAGGLTAGPRGATALLRLRPFQYVGDISYSLYLWHWPILILPELDRAHERPLAVRLALVAVSVGLAAASYRFVEVPLRTTGVLRRSRRATYLFAAGATCVCVLASALAAITPPLRTDTALPVWPATALTAATRDAPAPTVVGDNLEPTLSEAAHDAPVLPRSDCIAGFTTVTVTECVGGDTGSSRTALLLGDSHAEQWYSALDAAARTAGYRLVMIAKVSCPVIPVGIFNVRLNRYYGECDTWRKAAITAARRLDPNVVLFSYYLDEVLAHPSTDPGGQWAAGLRALMGELPSRSRKVVIGDVPHWSVAPLNCLSRHIDRAADCSQPGSATFDRPLATVEAGAATAAGARFIDVQSQLCPAGVCPTIMWNVVMYRDLNHITNTLALHFTGLFTSTLQELR